MNLSTRKLNIIKAFMQINNEDLLEKIESIFKIDNKNDKINNFEEIDEIIEKSLKQFDQGKTLTNKEVHNKIKAEFGF